MVDLKDKTVIITGAGSGIGASMALSFSQRGARLTLAARRLERLKEVARKCPGEVFPLAADLTREADRRRIVQQTLERWGNVDVLVNNAGLGLYGDFLSTNEEDWRKVFEVNLFALVFMTRAVLPHMQSRRSGIIVNMASIGGLIAHSDRVTPYVASKHAVIGFSRGLAKDLAGSGIRVLAVCPHLTDTEFFTASPGAEEMAPIVEKFKSFMDSPEDVARGILEQLDSDRLVVFPTAKPAKAFEKQRDL
ncbi:MAG TPA: SDR family oxidoreductase [Thermodesulfobacteriota bacterium]|nr:SDR family oxidoreductase [Thermodesulfobacteriota bacterium]